MQAQSSVGVADTSMTLPLACLHSEASDDASRSTGKERDAESGNDYFGARYYASSMGRFLSPDPGWFDAIDPQNPQTWNLYAYVLNNPLAIVDPDGYDCVYLNDAGNGVESVDTHSNSGECGDHGGYWVDGTVTHVNLFTNSNDVGLTGHTTDANGNKTTTSAYYTNADAPENQTLLNFMGYSGYHGTVDMIKLANYREQHPLAYWTAPSTSEIVTGCLFRGGGNLVLDLSPVGIVPDLANAAEQGSVNPLFNSGDKLHDAGNAVDVADRAASALEKTLPVAKVAGDILKPVGVTLAVYKGVVDTYGCNPAQVRVRHMLPLKKRVSWL